MEKEYYRKVMISLYRPVVQKKLYKYRRFIKNKLPYTYVPICKDKLYYKYFTEEGIARYLYDNYGYGTYMIQGWKWYSKCKKCKLSFNKKEYRKVNECPRCYGKERTWFKGFYNLCIYEVIKSGNTYIYNPINISNISKTKAWRWNINHLENFDPPY